MHQWFPIKWTTWAIIKSSTTSVTRGQYSRRSRNTWWFHYDMVKKCTVEFSRDNLEDNPIQEDQSSISHKRPLQGSCSIIVDRRAQSVTLLQGVSFLGPKALWTWSEMDSAQLVKGEWQLGFLWQFVTTDDT